MDCNLLGYLSQARTLEWVAISFSIIVSVGAQLSLLQQVLLKCIHIYLAALGLSCSMQDLVPRPGIEPGPSALGAWSIGHWTTREVPSMYII